MERVSQRDEKTKYAYIAHYKLVRFDEVLTKKYLLHSSIFSLL